MPCATTDQLLATSTSVYGNIHHDQMEIDDGIAAMDIDQGTPKYQIVVVFDWDDTLFPTSQMHSLGVLDSSFGQCNTNQLNVECMKEMAVLDTRICCLLEKAKSLGAVFIVTAAQQGWVESICQIFLPKVENFLLKREISVISAREWYRSKYDQVGNPKSWKQEVFCLIGSQSFSVDLGCPKHPYSMVSIGDADCEREACRFACSEVPFTISKTLKFVARPQFDQLGKQLEITYHALEQICNFDGQLDLTLDLSDKATTNILLT